MKLRLTKLLLLKPKSAIGVSMLDVISNALASVILLFFVLIALRAMPPSPERVLGILVVDYEISWPHADTRAPEIEVFLRRPKDGAITYDRTFGPDIASEFKSGRVDTIDGIWDEAQVLQVRGSDRATGRDYVRKRIFYMNPESPGDEKSPCEWEVGVIYVDDENFMDKNFPFLDSAELRLKAWFVPGAGSSVLGDTVLHRKMVKYPTEVLRDSVIIPRFQRL